MMIRDGCRAVGPTRLRSIRGPAPFMFSPRMMTNKWMKSFFLGREPSHGQFATLMDVVNQYDRHFGVGLSPKQKSDVGKYLKSL